MPMQKSGKDYPKRGQIYIANLDPGFGREIHKKRPVLIVSSDVFNQTRDHVVIIPSSSILPSSVTAEIIPAGKPKGLDKESVFLPIFIRSIDRDRLIKKVGRLSKQKLQKLEEAIKLVLGLN